MRVRRRGCSLLLTAAIAASLAGCGGAESIAVSHVISAAPVTTAQTASVPPTSPRPTATTAPSTPAATSPVPRVKHSAPVVPSATKLKAARSHPVEDPYYPDTSNPEVDALHYYLDLAWDGSTLTGRATETIRAAKASDSVRLDLSDALRVSAVELNGHSIQFTQANDGLMMDTGSLARNSTYTLTIDYSGTPTSTPAPSYRPDMTEGLGWVVDPDGSVHTFQEPYGAFTWYPVNDHPSDEALYDARIATPAGTVGVFNGELVSAQGTDSGTVNNWHLDEPAASYLITIAIGPYSRRTVTTADGVSISYWLLPQDQGLFDALRREGTSAFNWLVQHAGPYPFSSLGIVVVGGRSAMETQTLLTISKDAARRPDAVLEHEMSHQWFGDSVTPINWQGVWLNEGWAMYMQQWYETDTGMAPFAGGIAKWGSYDQASRLVSGPPGDYNPQSFGDSNIYLGPAMMLDRIRQQVGNRTFERLVRAWPAEHANQNVDREVFRAWLQAKTGKDFGPLMHKWLDSPQTPR